MIAEPLPGRRRTAIAVAGLAVVAGIAALSMKPAPSGATRPAAVEHSAPKRPSLHAAPPADAAALNAPPDAAGARRVPAALLAKLLRDARPAVIFFLKADCGCSREFAGWASALAPCLQPHAACTAVIEGSAAEADDFATATGLAIPFIAQAESGLAREWGVRKAGAVALAEPDGSVVAIWPGVSRQGFRDLATRLGVEPPLPGDLLAGIPGTAMAGCPLKSAGSAD